MNLNVTRLCQVKLYQHFATFTKRIKFTTRYEVNCDVAVINGLMQSEMIILDGMGCEAQTMKIFNSLDDETVTSALEIFCLV